MPTHRRIRPFNTKDTYPEQSLANDLCQAVVANGVVYLRGQVAQDLDTREDVGIGDPAAQAHKVMDNVELLLAECGSEPAHIVKCVIYLTDIREIGVMNEVWDAWVVPGAAPPRATVQAALADPAWKIEVVVTAAQA